ncbi:probable E3 ubiquitin-protein ligase RNF144A [Abrus precatorius]|uniref:RBR-type E3 ubiquitin transferase n=1 Tax=Abrus precatorius TaxID=3816 RepID=A0A8B8L6G2_ABRPR|nr:probable E3 ubiquitin-protein ligase RNF144A [Abrus precatorius]
MFHPQPPSSSPPPPPSPMTTLESPLNAKTTSIIKRRRTTVPPSAEVVDVESFCFTPISERGATKSNAISVDQYDNDRNLYLSIAASLTLSTPSHSVHVIDLSDTDDDDDVRILKFKPQNAAAFGKRKRNHNTVEKGEFSNTAPFVCEICTDTKTASDSFNIAGCCHVYCKECVATYVESKLQENVVNIACPVPRCRGLLEAEDCRTILDPGVLDRWGKALCEAVIAAEDKFYCPFGDCSALLIRDERENIRESECPNCRRVFCALCRVPWHQGIPCEEFQMLNRDEREKEDIMLMNLAREMRWKRCPKCRFYVAKSEGCMYMKCRCGIAFCYNCGAPSLTSSHYCAYCRR